MAGGGAQHGIDIIGPILTKAVTNVLESFGVANVVPGFSYIKKDIVAFGDVTAMIGMASSQVHAGMALSFKSAAILEIFSVMLCEKFEEVNDEVLDAAGELANMICGHAKVALGELGLAIEMASPIVISGSNVRIRDRVTRKTWVLPFQIDAGMFVLETNLPQ